MVESNDRLLKTVVGTIIAQILAGLQLDGSHRHLKCFWPSKLTPYATGFPARYDKADWELRLFVFIENLEKGQNLG